MKGWAKMIAPSHAVRDTVSRLIHGGPCLLTAVVLDGASHADTLTLYSGRDDLSGLEVLDILGVQNEQPSYIFASPILFQNGLYAKVTGTITDYHVMFIPLPNDYQDSGFVGDFPS